MARRLGYLYGSEQDFDDAKRATRIVLGIDTTSGAQLSKAGGIVYAEVTELRAGKNNKQAKAELRIFNATTQAFEAPTRPFYFDSDNAATADATTTDIFSSDDLTVGEVYEIIPYGDSSESEQWMAKPKGGGGTPSIWITTDNTGLSFADGAQYDFPSGTGTALTVDDAYYIATPWNTRIAAPNNYFGYFVQDGNDWYHQIEKFYVKPSANYPSGAGAGITTFTCYLNKADTSLNLGTNTAFPAGIKVLLAGFDNVNAGTNSLNYFNGKVFPASYDSAANIIYLDHPSF